MKALTTVALAAAPFAGRDEPWEWIGTGSPLVMNGKLYLFYGLHSRRNGEGWE